MAPHPAPQSRSLAAPLCSLRLPRELPEASSLYLLWLSFTGPLQVFCPCCCHPITCRWSPDYAFSTPPVLPEFQPGPAFLGAHLELTALLLCLDSLFLCKYFLGGSAALRNNGVPSLRVGFYSRKLLQGLPDWGPAALLKWLHLRPFSARLCPGSWLPEPSKAVLLQTVEPLLRTP